MTPLLIPFTLTLIFTYCECFVFQFKFIWPFSPFLIFAFYRFSFLKSLWVSWLCGLFLDAVSSQFHFGIIAFSHAFATFILYHQKRLFDDKPFAFSLFSALYSSIISFILIIEAPFSFFETFLDITLSSFFEFLYAFLWFSCPISLYTWIKK